MSQKKDNSTEQVFCIVHKEGSFNKDSESQKQHEEKSGEECVWKTFDAKKHIPKYDESSIKEKYSFHFIKGNEQIKQDILDSNIQTLRPQTLLSNGTKIILVYLPTRQKIVKGTGDNVVISYEYLNSAYFVMCKSSESRTVLPFNDKELTESYRIKVLPDWNDMRWNVLDLKKWITEKTKTDPKTLYNLINNTTRIYLEYATESEYTKFNLWNIATYFFELFDAFPYNDYTGVKRAGKTKSLQFQKLVCFNSIMSADITSSATFRIIEGIGSTVLLDETESFKDKKNEQAQAVRNILMQGFLKDQYAVRNETTKDKNFTPTQYNLYSPKSMAHISTFDDVLEERCIKQVLIRSLNPEIKNTWCTEEDKEFSQIRNLSYRLFLDYADEINQLKKQARKLLQVNSRELQLWTPLITLALFFENHGVSNLTNDIKLSVSASSQSRQIDDEQESRELRVLSFLDKTGVGFAEKKEYVGDNPLYWIPITTLFHQLDIRSAEYEIPEWFARKHLTEILGKLGFKQDKKRAGYSWFITRNVVDEIKERMGINDKCTTLDNFDDSTGTSKITSHTAITSQTSQSVTKPTYSTKSIESETSLASQSNIEESTISQTSPTSQSNNDSRRKSEEIAESEQSEAKTIPPNSSHKSEQSEASEVSKNNKTSPTSQGSQYSHFKCNTCGSGWFEINETSRLSDEKLLDIHKKQGHKIECSDKGDDSS